jgi:hypothetical protein
MTCPNPLFFIRTVSLCPLFGGVCMDALGTKFSLSVVFQSKCTVQTLEDVLRAYMLPWNNSWEDQLALVEPYESLYGQNCNSSLCWEVPSERLLVSPYWIQHTHGKEYQI